MAPAAVAQLLNPMCRRDRAWGEGGTSMKARTEGHGGAGALPACDCLLPKE
jgi:hypothetical protein